MLVHGAFVAGAWLDAHSHALPGGTSAPGELIHPAALRAKMKIKIRHPPGSGPESAQNTRVPQEDDSPDAPPGSPDAPPDPPGEGETRTNIDIDTDSLVY